MMFVTTMLTWLRTSGPVRITQFRCGFAVTGLPLQAHSGNALSAALWHGLQALLDPQNV